MAGAAPACPAIVGRCRDELAETAAKRRLDPNAGILAGFPREHAMRRLGASLARRDGKRWRVLRPASEMQPKRERPARSTRLAAVLGLVAAFAAVEGLAAGAAVFGSFASPALAEALRRAAWSANWHLDARTVAGGRQRGHRHSRDRRRGQDACEPIRALIEEARVAGFADAWYLAGCAVAPDRGGAGSCGTRADAPAEPRSGAVDRSPDAPRLHRRWASQPRRRCPTSFRRSRRASATACG